MQLSELSVRRPVLAAVIAILLVLVGLVGFFSLPVREYPATDPPIVSVSTTYTGAAANVVETRVTQVLENAIAGIEGIQEITSRSRDGQSEITVEFGAKRSVDSAANDVRDRVGGVLDDLPEEVIAPEIRKVDADAQPVLYLVVANPGWSQLELSDYIDRNLADRFSALDGVARVQIAGEARPSMRIWLKPEKLAAFGLAPADVETALRSQNVELPAGRLESRDQNMTLRVTRAFATPAQFAALVVKRGSTGYLVRLGDVARVEIGAENPYAAFRLNGQPAVGIAIVRQSGANTLAVAQAAKALAKRLTPDLPSGTTITVGSDDSLFISHAISGVWETLAEAALLVVLVIYLFLGSWRATLIPAVTVPICLLATFAVLWMLGFSVNLLTLLALVLAIGLVVDDAIVVLENVYHRIEQGEPPLVAAVRGTRQVAFAVMSTTIVVCAVFVPVMFLAGQTGLLFRELAGAMIAAVAFSGFVALSLAPMLCSKMLRHQTRGRLAQAVDTRLQKIETWYAKLLDKVLARPLVALLSILLFLALSGGLFMTLKAELTPAEDVGVITAQLSAPEGTGFAAMDRLMVEAQKPLLELTKKGAVRTVLQRTPGSQTASDDFNSGIFVVFLKEWDQRDVTTKQVVEQLNKLLVKQTQLRGNASVRSSIGRSRGQPVNFVIAGASYEALARARDAILAAARDNPGLINPDADYKETKPQLQIQVDTVRAGDLGVSVSEVSQALQSLLGSRRVSTYVDRGEEYRVIVQADAVGRATPEQLAAIQVHGRDGTLIPLANLVTLTQSAGAKDLGRFNKLRAITLSAGLAPGYSLGQALSFLEEKARTEPDVLAIGYRGESKAFKETGGSITLIFFLTIALVYLVLAAQFESFVHPATIIMTVPLAVGGGIIGLALTGNSLNLYSQIGIVMLVGLAAKNGILIVEFANQLRDEGQEIFDAVRHAAVRRLRPILMTSIATVVGAIPLALASGAGAGARSAIGVVIVFGVSLATLITLILIPMVYARLARYTGSPDAVSRRLEAEM